MLSTFHVVSDHFLSMTGPFVDFFESFETAI